jgi:Protein of unknown function (DUF736).
MKLYINLRPNQFKKKDSEPDYKAESKFNNTWMNVAGWNKPMSNGGTYISISIEPMTPEYAEKAEARQKEYESRKVAPVAPVEKKQESNSDSPF